MSKRSLLVVNCHPDPSPERFCHALADAYQRGADRAGHTVVRLNLGELSIPPLRSRLEWESGHPPRSVRIVQDALRSADHFVLIYPLWLGEMPAAMKSFLEQVLRPDFAFVLEENKVWKPLLKHKSVRVVVTMGMPAAIYRLYFRAFGLKALKRSILQFCGFSPIRVNIIGSIEASSVSRHRRWLDKMIYLGQRAR